MRIPSLLVVLLLGLAVLPFAHAQPGAFFIDPRALQIVERFERAWRAASAVTFRDVKVERLRNGKVVKEELAVKYQRPGRAYLRMLKPREGQEVIYDRTKNTKQLTVHPGHFPDLTLSLDIEGMLATRDQHHTVASVGFDQAMHILRAGIERAKREPYGDRLEYGGSSKLDGHEVERVVMRAGTHPASKVSAHEGETLLSFARRVDMDAYVIYIANPAIRSLASRLDGGESYIVPAYYAPRCESWFDKQTGMPLKQVMWSEDGSLYESYEHLDLVLNPKLSDADFDPQNPGYGF